VIARAARSEIAEALGDRVRFDAPLARFTSLRVGGPADALATPESRTDLARLLALCARHRVPHLVLGAGFNTLALDAGVEGVVIQLGRLRGLEERPGGTLRAEAGVSHNQLIKLCIRLGFSGLEFGAGIPGTIGGWVAMNAGIPSREVKDVVREVEVMAPSGGGIRHLERRALRFVYRGLRGLAPGSVILSALFAVSFTTPALVKTEVDRLLARRAQTQPLDIPSCGSVFKNPPGDHAGRLIELVGLKGHRVGGAQISPLHANFITNLGGATAADVLALIHEAQARVFAQTGRRLVPEVKVIGRKA
jgi:UDP-N-acetylmuramate dehydrogenase